MLLKHVYFPWMKNLVRRSICGINVMCHLAAVWNVKLDKYWTEWQFNLSSNIRKPPYFTAALIATDFSLFSSPLFFTSFLQMQIREVWFEIWFAFRDKAATLPARALEVAEPFSVTPTGRFFLMASFITSSNDSIHSILDQFNVKPHEISQCAENEVSTSVQSANSDVVLHLNTNPTPHWSHQLPVALITVA